MANPPAPGAPGLQGAQTIDQNLNNGGTSLADNEVGQYGAADLGINNGVQAGGGNALQTAGQSAQEAASTGSNPAMLQAIRNQYNGIAGKQIQGIVNQNNWNTPMLRSSLMNQSAQNMSALNQIGINETLTANNNNQNWQIARAQALSSTIGSVGYAIGRNMASPRGDGGGANSYGAGGMGISQSMPGMSPGPGQSMLSND